MKGTFIIFLFSLVILVGCKKEQSFVIGDCIQNPDSIIVWKIKAINGNNYTLSQRQDKREPDIKTIQLSGMWTKSNCPNL